MYRTLAHRGPAVAVLTAMISALSIAGAVGASATSSTTASSDGLHLLPDVWTGGCEIDFSLDPSASAEYRANVFNALTAIAGVTGMSFNQVAPGDSGADIRYSVVASLPDGVAGLASNFGDVTLLDVGALPSANSAKLDSYVRDRIIAHETLHVLGLDHDDDAWTNHPDEVMSPTPSWRPLDFGSGDVAGMEHLRGINRCTRPSPGAPLPVPSVDPTMAAPVQVETGQSKPVTVSTGMSPSNDGLCTATRHYGESYGTCTAPRPNGSAAPATGLSKNDESVNPPKHAEMPTPPQSEVSHGASDSGGREHRDIESR